MLRFHEVCGATDTWRLINQLLQRNIPGNMYHEATKNCAKEGVSVVYKVGADSTVVQQETQLLLAQYSTTHNRQHNSSDSTKSRTETVAPLF